MLVDILDDMKKLLLIIFWFATAVFRNAIVSYPPIKLLKMFVDVLLVADIK